jgi:hypothetical protein
MHCGVRDASGPRTGLSPPAGEVAAARMLIGLGADPSIRDARFNATPLGWAEHFRQAAMADFLRPLSRT